MFTNSLGMGYRPRVLVAGPDEGLVAETAAGLEAEGIAAVSGLPSASGELDVDCVVTHEHPSDAVEALRDRDPTLPVVLFGEEPGAATGSLGEGIADFVYRGSDGQYAVLAHRIEATVGAAGTAFDRADELLASLDDGVYRLDDEGRFTFVNEAMTDLTGYEADELLGEHTGVIKDRETVAEAEARLAGLLSEDGPADVGTTFELDLQTKRGGTVPCEDHMTVLYGPDGSFRGTAGVIRTITERNRRDQMLSGIQETSRELMQAPDREEVAEIAAGAAADVLGAETNAVHLYDADRQELWPAAAVAATADDALGSLDTVGLNEGQPGRVFASGEPEQRSDAELTPGPGETTVRSAICYPVGVHGTLSVLSTEPDAFDELDRRVVALLATNAAAACNRAKREQEVRETRQRIATILDRINGLIENTIEVLVEATTREAVEAGVCEQLAAADPYTFAWLGRPDLREEVIEAREWAGPAGVDIAGTAVPLRADTVGTRAFEGGEATVSTDLSDAEGWLADARDAGVESVMTVPLTYNESSYGVLYVCADDPDAFDEREQVVLQALGRAVANTINAIESGKILSADKVIELEFTVEDRDLLLSRLSAGTGATLTSESVVTQDDGSLRVYLTAEGADSDDVLAALNDAESVTAATLVAEHEGAALFDCTVAESLVATLADHGAVPKAISGESGIARFDIELPYETDAREVFDIVERRYDRTDLVGYHEHERPVRTQQEFRTALSERFTDRQETALRTAFLGGFFEWPREVDGDELAEAMDISRPTYHQHLRAAQQKVFEELFEP